MTITLIAAMSENRVIGREGNLPWRLPDDLRFFKRMTVGKHLVMGRKTFESPGHPLPDRTSIVITRRADYNRSDCIVAHSLEEALRWCDEHGVHEVLIGGGGEIYTQALPHADEIHLTVVHAKIEGDAFFPEFDPSQWRLIDEEHHPADEKHEYAFTFKHFKRNR